MCGIAVLLQAPHIPNLPPWPFWPGSNPNRDATPEPLSHSDLLPLLSRRGPNFQQSLTLHPFPNSSLQFLQTTLSHRGSPPPTLQTSSNDILLYNGELYADNAVSAENDTQYLRKLFSKATADVDNFSPSVLLAQLDTLRGPWTLIFWHAVRRRLYFGRDVLGRRSLMIRVLPGRALELVSVAPRHKHAGFVEVPPNGLAYVDFCNDLSMAFGLVGRECVPVVPQRFLKEKETRKVVAGSGRDMYVSFLPLSWLRSKTAVAGWGHGLEASAQGFLDCFRRSIRRRLITKHQFTANCSRYSVLFSGGIDSLVIAAVLAELLQDGEFVHLINVAFGEGEEAIASCPDRKSAISGLAELRTLFPQRNFDLCCVNVRARLADDTLDQNIRHLISPCDQPMDSSIGTAIWLAAQGKGYSYKSQGGPDTFGSENINFTSTARILFSGLGADELMGGYKGRHRKIFRDEGVEGIKREMDADLSRLWFRNLGRDDRLISDHGKEVRHPFLDEDLISFVTSLPLVEHVCDLAKRDGVGDKHLLRRAAALLGFSGEALCRVKRAIQFGSRSKQVIERKRPK